MCCPSCPKTTDRWPCFHGVVAVASDTSDQAPNFYLDPLETSERNAQRYLDWFRRFVDLRSANAAERVIRTAAYLGFEPDGPCRTSSRAACTDHLYLGGGHSLDFANKSFELLDHIGWDESGEVLPGPGARWQSW